ncbi:MAG: hypothetical protein JW726_18910, partial [Anaerolineales bacterium]|nr:hypothetical protein [Anaerolineales bacterium]
QSTDIQDGQVRTADIYDGAVTQAKAPTLLAGPGSNWKTLAGDVYFSTGSSGWVEKTVTFPSAFSSNPKVLITLWASGSPDEIGCWKYAGVYAVGTTSFKIRAYNDNCAWLGCHFNWLAIGP